MPFTLPNVVEPNTSASLVDAQPAWAGVSFVFEDAFWCDWLYREFDGLRVPRPLIHRPSRHGLPYPDRLSVSPDPADPVQLENYAETLRSAQHLIVVVSPSSGLSELMKEHMRTFRAAGGEERIVALVVKGEPGSPTAEPASISDKEWMPGWLQWRFSESGFSEAERTEPLVVDARLGVATLAEVRAQLLAAMLEVPEEQLSELGVVPRNSTRPNYPSEVTPSQQVVESQESDFEEKGGGIGWMTAAIFLTACCGIGALILSKQSQDRVESTTQAALEKSSNAATKEKNAPPPKGAPMVASAPVPTPKKEAAPASEPGKPAAVVAVSPLPQTDTREFRALVERRDRFFFLAESRIQDGAGEEAYDIMKQAADVAAIALRKSAGAAPDLLRAAEIRRRLGQLATQYTSPVESREHFETARDLMQQLRDKGPVGEDGARLIIDIESGLKKLSAQ